MNWSQNFWVSWSQKCAEWIKFSKSRQNASEMTQFGSFSLLLFSPLSANFYFLPGQLDALLCGNSSDSGWVAFSTLQKEYQDLL